jgi:hypothetical protein
MDGNWKLGSLEGKDKKWWSKAVMTLYSTGLCIPEKGNLGEVFTALYFLFCCDECRQAIDDNGNYTTFSVPLEDWINSLLDSSSNSVSSGKRKRDAPIIQLNFIHVCRDYTRTPWSGLADPDFLENLYKAGTAFYTFPGCELIDFMAPTVIIKPGEKPTYSSVVVSIKSRVYFAPNEARKLCEQLKSKVDSCHLKSTLCIVCVLGQDSESNDGECTYDVSNILTQLEEGMNVATVLRIPRKDRFGLTDIFVEMTTITEQSEILSSHSFLRARGVALKALVALRKFVSNNLPGVVSYFNDMMGYMDVDLKRQTLSCDAEAYDDENKEGMIKKIAAGNEEVFVKHDGAEQVRVEDEVVYNIEKEVETERIAPKEEEELHVKDDFPDQVKKNTRKKIQERRRENRERCSDRA